MSTTLGMFGSSRRRVPFVFLHQRQACTTLQLAIAASDSDWIVGYGYDNTSQYRAFVLRPNE